MRKVHAVINTAVKTFVISVRKELQNVVDYQLVNTNYYPISS